MEDVCGYLPPHMKSLTSTMCPRAQKYFTSYIPCYWHILLHKYGYYTAHTVHNALIRYGHINSHWCTCAKTQPHASPTLHHIGICARNKFGHQRVHTCHIQTYTCATYEVTGFIHVTRNAVEIMIWPTMQTLTTLSDCTGCIWPRANQPKIHL